MPNFKKYHIWELLLMLLVISINSVMVVEWLNSSLFIDFSIDIDDVNASFYKGASLIFLITMLVYAFVGTLSVSILLTDLMFGVLAVANNIKADERNEFTTFSDLKTIAAPKDLLAFGEIPVINAVVFLLSTIIIILILQVATIKLAKETHLAFNKKVRIVFFVIALVTLSAIAVKPNAYNIQVLGFEKTDSHNFNPLKRARRNGFLPAFLHTVDPIYMSRPNHYKKSVVEDIEQTYSDVSAEINQTRNHTFSNSQTILYLSESLMDPETLPGLLSNETPIPYISDMSHNGIGGTLYSQYIGGGTANIEWSIITSFSLEVLSDPVTATPYSDFYVGSSNHQTILSQYENDKTIAIHPYTAHLYNRKSVYDVIGFDKFLYLNHGIQHTEKLANYRTVSDEALNKDILRFVGQDDVGYLHVLTMQNHSPYNEAIPSMTYKPQINTDVFPEDKESELSNYLQGLKASDEAIESLIQQLDQSQRDINLLFFGDHFPSPFRGLEDRFTHEQLHETPWFIYMNNERGNKKVQFDGLSPMFFMPVLLREGDYKVTPFQGLMEQLLDKGVKRIGKDYVVTGEGKVSDPEVPDDIMSLVDDYRIIQYDALFGQDWLSDKFYTLDD